MEQLQRGRSVEDEWFGQLHDGAACDSALPHHTYVRCERGEVHLSIRSVAGRPCLSRIYRRRMVCTNLKELITPARTSSEWVPMAGLGKGDHALQLVLVSPSEVIPTFEFDAPQFAFYGQRQSND